MKRLDTIFGLLSLGILSAGLWLAFTHTWIAKDINRWQLRVMDGNNFFPFLTAAIIAIPPMLVLLVIKKALLKKYSKINSPSLQKHPRSTAL
jgi:hypothetical protein